MHVKKSGEELMNGKLTLCLFALSNLRNHNKSAQKKSKIYEFAYKWVLNNKDAFSGKDNSCYFKLSKLIRFSAEQVNVFLPQTMPIT